MAYAIRYNSPTHLGMLMEMDSRALAKIKREQDEADDLREAYWDTPEPRHHIVLPPDTFPYYEPIPAYRAHQWVKEGGVHETLLYTDEGKIRRARD